METKWAFIFYHPDTDPVRDRTEVAGGDMRGIFVPVPDKALGLDVARKLIAEGATAIELCGFFGPEGAAQMYRQLDGAVPVGATAWGANSIRMLGKAFNVEGPPPGFGLIIAGLAMSAAVALIMLADGLFQLFGGMFAPDALAAMMAQGGVPLQLTAITGTAVVCSALLYAFPRTTVLGAILLTGYLGGALAIDMRVNGPGSPAQVVSVLLGAMVWGGLYLQNGAIRALLPLIRRG